MLLILSFLADRIHILSYRELHYSIKLPKEIDCDMLLVQTLHQGLYISNDQLNDLKRMKMVRSFYFDLTQD